MQFHMNTHVMGTDTATKMEKGQGQKATYHQGRYDNEALSIVNCLDSDSAILKKSSFKPLKTFAKRKQDLDFSYFQETIIWPEKARRTDILLNKLHSLCTRKQAAYGREKPREGQIIKDINAILMNYAGHNIFILPDRWKLVRRLFTIVPKCSPRITKEVVAWLDEMGVTAKDYEQINKSEWFNSLILDLITCFKKISHPTKCLDPSCRATHFETYELVHLVLDIYYPCFSPSTEAIKKREVNCF
ncbi:MAG: hypothetical protein C0392_01060 [Syntrophus sp. (in: bacteria)]|nr:hypothetical protein [Syntrophus sp. (in: bacteria)]